MKSLVKNNLSPLHPFLLVISIYYAEASDSSCILAIDLSNLQIGDRIPSHFLSNDQIQNLTMKNNSIKFCEEDSFSALPNLNHLDLSNNNMSQINLFSFRAPNLKTLILDDNILMKKSVKNVPSSISYDDYYSHHRSSSITVYLRTSEPLDIPYIYPELHYLSLRNVNLQLTLSQISSLKFPILNTLDISENNLKSYKFSKGDIPTTVKTLIMINTGLTSIENFPFNIIEELIISKNNFSAVSDNYKNFSLLSLHNFNSLKKLIISDCAIENVDEDAFKHVEDLLELDISGNNLKELPNGTFDYTPSLIKLNLSRNRFSQLPNLTVLEQLNTLILDEMGLVKEIMDCISCMENLSLINLKILSIQKNGIVYVPSTFLENFPNLEELNLSYNYISRLPSRNFQKNLKILNLYHNNIEDIESIALTEFESLKILNIGSNKFKKLKIRSMQLLPENATIIFD